jgi:hypothetical protein
MEAICNETTAQCEVVASANTVDCDDGTFCTVNDKCDGAGQCAGGPPNTCGLQPGDCDQVTCDEGAQSCTLTPLPSGASCTPGDLCQVGGTCQNGLCIGPAKDCFFAPVPNECYVSQCNPANGMCEPQPGNTGLGCTDTNDLCTVNKVCDNAGNCGGGGPKDCSILSVGCNNGVCDTVTGQCMSVPIPDGMTCLAATDDCNQGICTAGNCLGNPINDGMMCDDGLSCTSATTCSAGVCGGGNSNVTVYFSEDFSSNSAGWTLDSTWQIGPAMAATCSFGNDPATDHSTSADNGIAGVNIGGCYDTSIHPDYCITSPNIDTAAAATVWFGYWRHLHSDYPGYMTHTVGVSANGGANWTTLYAVPSGQWQNDADWTQATYDVTAYKSANMRVRFCYAGTSAFIIEGGGWNVDDVLLASGICN